jgi:hypothetical protein
MGIPALALGVTLLFLVAVRVTGAKRGAEPPGASGPGEDDRRPGAARSTRSSTLTAAVAVLGILGVSGALALSGVLADATRKPPALMPLVLVCLGVALAVALSPLGGRIASGLPLSLLVGAQAFRLPLELVMHRAATEGVMPVEMSYAGYNFDIVTGATALVLGIALHRGAVPRAVVLAWNVMGAALLAIIVGVAVAALPWIAAFGPDHLNTWVLHFPYVWLPTALVPAALFGHVVVFRRLGA